MPLVNEDVEDGVTLHWHGVDVPNAEDGVAGVTRTRWRGRGPRLPLRRATTPARYWYHSHQVSHEQVQRGLFGALVVIPAADARSSTRSRSPTLYDGSRTLNGGEGDRRSTPRPGQPVRVRVVNTDNGAVRVWADRAPYQVLAVDGRDVNEPAAGDRRTPAVPAGGRADLERHLPVDGRAVRVELGGADVVLGPARAPAPSPAAGRDARPAALRHAGAAQLRPGTRRPHASTTRSAAGPASSTAARLWWSINGHLFPDVPMFLVDEGDVVRVRIENHSGEVHPMHLHGHHAVVLSRDGGAATGSPWWVDSLDVENGETYEIAFVADNPGIWMDHCHNLTHAAQGLVAHLMYEG